MTLKLVLRPQTDDDLDFLRELYASTREQELQHVGWSEELKRSFLDSQFAAQWAHYSNHYYDAEFLIVERDARRIGRLYLWRGENDIRIVDISLVAEERGRGLGGALLGNVLTEAFRSGKSASIHVERFNPALRLYQRLGFEHVEDTGVYFLMKWTPQSAARNIAAV